MKTLGVLVLVALVAAVIGCGSSSEEGDFTVGSAGEETTMSRDDALDFIFDHEEFPRQLTEQICRVSENRGEDEARRLFVKTWSSDSFEFSGGELFDEAASRCPD